MNRKKLSVGLVVVLGCVAGACNRSSTSSTAPAFSSGDSSSVATRQTPRTDQEAVEEAIQRHLEENKGINMSAMEMRVSKVQINGDQAQADAEFRLKQGGTSMSMTYFLERHADGWLVIRNQPNSSGQFAHPPMDKIHSGAGSAASPAFPNVSDFLNRKSAEKSTATGAAHPQ
jgi:hypothetical protein